LTSEIHNFDSAPTKDHFSSIFLAEYISIFSNGGHFEL